MNTYTSTVIKAFNDDQKNSLTILKAFDAVGAELDYQQIVDAATYRGYGSILKFICDKGYIPAAGVFSNVITLKMTKSINAIFDSIGHEHLSCLFDLAIEMNNYYIVNKMLKDGYIPSEEHLLSAVQYSDIVLFNSMLNIVAAKGIKNYDVFLKKAVELKLNEFVEIIECRMKNNIDDDPILNEEELEVIKKTLYPSIYKIIKDKNDLRIKKHSVASVEAPAVPVAPVVSVAPITTATPVVSFMIKDGIVNITVTGTASENVKLTVEQKSFVDYSSVYQFERARCNREKK